MTENDRALARLQKSRQALLQAIERLSEAELTGLQVEGIWTIKDVLGHIAAWEESCQEPLERFLYCGNFESEEIPDHDAWNAVQAERRRALPLQVVIDELLGVRRRLLMAASQGSAEQWAQKLALSWGEETTLAGMLNGLAWHEEEHLKNILAWRP